MKVLIWHVHGSYLNSFLQGSHAGFDLPLGGTSARERAESPEADDGRRGAHDHEPGDDHDEQHEGQSMVESGVPTRGGAVR